MTPRVGMKAQRRRRGRRPSRPWHHVDSLVASRIVTRCGKEMEREAGSTGEYTLEFTDLEIAPEALCQACYRKEQKDGQ